MKFSEDDCVVFEEALIDLLAKVQESAPHFRHTPGEKTTELIFSIASARKKLKLIREEHSQDFSDQELKAMYWAVLDTRDEAREFLLQTPLSDPGHNDAVEVQRLCNRLLKKFPDSLRMGNIEL